MSNVLPTKEQGRVWVTSRQRFIALGAVTFSFLAVIAIATLLPSYLLLALNHPESPALKAQSTDKDERIEATKIQSLITQILPVIIASSSAMDLIGQALDGMPDGIAVNKIAYNTETKQRTVVIGGTAQSRDEINALRKELEAKGIYKSVSVPVGDLIGATGNQFTVTLTLN